ncbi:MAG: transposase [Chitinophagaceae bacterium]
MQYENETKDSLAYQRKSYMKLGEIFFWTATIKNWQRLLTEDKYKEVIISSLEYLSNEKLIDVFAFVIMPNHIHLIWRINRMNGKESPQGSFLKYTAHLFKKMLKDSQGDQLNKYKSDAVNKSFEFWQRDPLAILLYSKEIAVQKLKYIHNNPLAEHWQLVADPTDYKYCSANYYEKNERQFVFLKDLYDEF